MRVHDKTVCGADNEQAVSGKSCTSDNSRPQNNKAAAYGDIVHVLSHTLGAANRYLMKLMAHEGLKNVVPSHGDILVCLFSNDEMPMAGLADVIGKDPSTVTALVRKLIEAGYVEKHPGSQDKRVNYVSLTEKGRALKPAFDRISAELIESLLADVDQDDLATTYQTLQTMQANMNTNMAIKKTTTHCSKESK